MGAPGRAHLLGGGSPLLARQGEQLAEGKGFAGDCEPEGSWMAKRWPDEQEADTASSARDRLAAVETTTDQRIAPARTRPRRLSSVEIERQRARAVVERGGQSHDPRAAAEALGQHGAGLAGGHSPASPFLDHRMRTCTSDGVRGLRGDPSPYSIGRFFGMGYLILFGMP